MALMIAASARWLAAALWCCLTLVATAQPAAIPELSGRVVDTAQVLSAPARSRIEAALTAHEYKTTNQIVVLTVQHIGDEGIEQYAQRVFDSWKLGLKGTDNGVLLVIAPRERVLRIHVGYGLEGALPDAVASRIVREVIVPRFKADDFGAGIDEGVKAIIGHLDRSAPLAEAPPTAKKSGASFFYYACWLIVLLVLAYFTYLKATSPRGWLAYALLTPLWWLVPATLIGPAPAVAVAALFLALYPVCKLLVRRTEWYAEINKQRAEEAKRFVPSGSGRRSGSWYSGGRSSSSGGGGYSGGGGSSGGGGASGRW